jgi:hypothetical protein
MEYSWGVSKIKWGKISKIDDNDFKTHMASDIVFLSETHATYADTLTCEGYKCQKPILVMLTHYLVKVISVRNPY